VSSRSPGRLVDAHLHDAVGLVDRLLGHALERALHERDPDRQRGDRAGLVAAERARLVEADPRDADDACVYPQNHASTFSLVVPVLPARSLRPSDSARVAVP
jgi:hypothetical protein